MNNIEKKSFINALQKFSGDPKDPQNVASLFSTASDLSKAIYSELEKNQKAGGDEAAAMSELVFKEIVKEIKVSNEQLEIFFWLGEECTCLATNLHLTEKQQQEASQLGKIFTMFAYTANPSHDGNKAPAVTIEQKQQFAAQKYFLALYLAPNDIVSYVEKLDQTFLKQKEELLIQLQEPLKKLNSEWWGGAANFLFRGETEALNQYDLDLIHMTKKYQKALEDIDDKVWNKILGTENTGMKDEENFQRKLERDAQEQKRLHLKTTNILKETEFSHIEKESTLVKKPK